MRKQGTFPMSNLLNPLPCGIVSVLCGLMGEKFLASHIVVKLKLKLYFDRTFW
jgi:hypothetical protein